MRRILTTFTTPTSVEALTGVTRSTLMFHFKGKGVFYRPFFPTPKIIDTPDLSVSSCLNSLEGEKDFLWCLNLPRGYISSFPGCTEDFQTCLNLLTQRGLVICSCLCTLTTRRTFSDASTCPGVTSPPPPDVLRTFKLASICLRKEVL